MLDPDVTWTRGHVGKCCSRGAAGQESGSMETLGIGEYLPTILGSIQGVKTACVQPEEPGKN